MRTCFIAVFTIKAFLSFPLWARPVPETEHSPAKDITQLLERLSAGSSLPVTLHYACRASTSEYGLEIRLWDGRSYCQYLRYGKLRITEEFTPWYLDEETLHASVDEFFQENNGQSKNRWDFTDNNLRYVYNSGVRKERILMPRESFLSSGSGLNTTDDSGKPTAPGNEIKIDIGAVILGGSLIVLALLAIAGFIIEANKHCVLHCCQWGWGKLSNISFR